MKFEEALAAVREGKKVRRADWPNSRFWYLKDSRIVDVHRVDIIFNGSHFALDDWEIYEEPKWEPEGGDWMIDSEGYVCEGKPDTRSAEFGTERKTKEAAEKASDKMREFNRLLAYVDEHAPEWEPAWGGGSYNWYVYYYSETGLYTCAASTCTKRIGTVYMPEEVAKKLVEDLNSGGVEL